MFARTVITFYYITCFASYVLVLLYLIKLENENCIVNNKMHYTLKNTIYAGLGVPLSYLVLLSFAYITKDVDLIKSLKNVFHLTMLIINGIVSITLFIYMLQFNECEGINDKERYKKIYKSINILSYILLCFYGIYLISYIYYKYIVKPKIILVNNVERVRPTMINNKKN
jgi:phosphatidylserine synthase